MTNTIIMAGQIAGALSAIGAVVFVIVKYVVVKPIQNYIDLRTHQIQPNSNGGKSLPDIALGIQRVERKVESLNKRVDALENTLKVPQI
jgi:F0F1-type ATP synthase membrane subunit b/b'